VHAAFEPPPQRTALRRAKAAIERPLYLFNERASLSRAELVIANSERTRKDLQERLGIDGSRIRTVYYGIDPERFAPVDAARRDKCRVLLGLNARPKVAFVGALGDRRKGFDTLYAAWSELCSRSTWDCDLVVVGRGSELDRWRGRAARDHLDDRVTFLGFRSDVPDVLAACDALVAPTRYEAYGLGVQEALCCGLPAIVSADSGVAERFPPALGALLLQDPNSVTELVQRLDAWRGDIERFRDSTLALSATLRRRTWDTMAEELVALLA
jgi:glycosyltransferase involved in cell wall biosynthesis